MILLCNGSGQMCNRVKEFAHCVATALAKQESLYNLKILPYAHYFEFPKQKVKIGYLHNRFLYKACNSLDRILRKSHLLSDEDKKFLGITLVNDPDFTNYRALFEHQKEVVEFFTFKEEYRQKAEQKVNAIREQGFEILVGVHVRRGDYEYWREGKYLYSADDYRLFMESLCQSIGKNVAFIISTNDSEITDRSFGEKLNVFVSNDNQAVDLLVLQMSDYIMGPPSTFSWWAAFSGHKKYLTLVDKKQNVLEESFEFLEKSLNEKGSML